MLKSNLLKEERMQTGTRDKQEAIAVNAKVCAPPPQFLSIGWPNSCFTLRSSITELQAYLAKAPAIPHPTHPCPQLYSCQASRGLLASTSWFHASPNTHTPLFPAQSTEDVDGSWALGDSGEQPGVSPPDRDPAHELTQTLLKPQGDSREEKIE